MDKTALVDQYIKGGKQILETLDQTGLFFPMAMWMFHSNSNEWRLFFGKEDIHNVGSRGYYKKIQKVLNKINLTSDITVSDIYLISTDDEIAMLIKKMIKTGKKVSGSRLGGNVINGYMTPDAYIYRAA